MKILSHASARKETKRLKSFKFRPFLVVFKWHLGREGVKVLFCLLSFFLSLLFLLLPLFVFGFLAFCLQSFKYDYSWSSHPFILQVFVLFCFVLFFAQFICLYANIIDNSFSASIPVKKQAQVSILPVIKLIPHPLSGISGLSFDSPFLSLLVFLPRPLAFSVLSFFC